MAAVVALQLTGTIASLFLPAINADIIDEGVVRGDTAFILRAGAVMLGVSLLHMTCTVVAIWFGARTAMALGRDLRARAFHRVLTFSAHEVSRFGAPSLLTRSTNDVQQLQTLVMTAFTMLVVAPIMMVGGVVMALREDVGLSWLVAAVVPILAAIVTLLMTRMVPKFREMQRHLDRINQILREQLAGIRVVRAFVREPLETRRFDEGNTRLTDVATSAGRWMAAMFPSVMLVMNVSTTAVLWFGGARVESGAMQIGSLTAFLTYLVQILISVMLSVVMLMQVPRAAAAAERLSEVLDTEPAIAPPAPGVRALPRRGHLAFDRVGFRFPGADQPLLRSISFTAQPGTTLAIVGATGTGKTTLVSLIPRLFEASEGHVRLDGVDIREIDPETLWSRIGLVPQRAYLFSGTVASNLRVGKPGATEDELWAALEIAQARGFVEAMPGGLEAPIAQGGTNVSGGQRQRLAIARAVIRRPEVYLFDDAFSALDVATDARLRAALKPITADATVVIVAQRVATIADADQICVIEGGRMVGLGTHDALRETCPTYAEIIDSQRAAEDA
ncbi:MAG: ABC transporter ATP-binding protein [Alphaproteobacteria bacterium]|nr:ABC transporter ATP-binding protein [Alphaproteobacteria bacterium]